MKSCVGKCSVPFPLIAVGCVALINGACSDDPNGHSDFNPADCSGEWFFTETTMSSTGECTDEIGGQSTFSCLLEIGEDLAASLVILTHSEAPEFVGTVFSGAFDSDTLRCAADAIPFNCGESCEDPCEGGTVIIKLRFLDLDNATGQEQGLSCCDDGGMTVYSLSGGRISAP